VIDPSGRLPITARLLAEDGIARIVITRAETQTRLPAGVEHLALPSPRGQLAPEAILAALAERGFHHILIEGGADTVSRFLAAGCLDRLHVVIAPIILGAGRTSVSLAPIARVEEAMRVPMRIHKLGEEVLLDCDLSAQRIAVAKIST
jgi:diaminohydroxyphosphoribosylaminopyrimidine deaminase/5-amino-6-(5-phosphoribosylamino)uracil reductase